MNRNSLLDSLRAFSILLVVIAHLGFQNLVPGGLGVTIFFGISGFIITNLLIQEFEVYGDIKLLKFYRRRFWKIVPPFFFLVFLPSLIFWERFSISTTKFLSQCFFYFNWAQILEPQDKYFPSTGVVWSLAIEEQFYIGIASLIFLFQLKVNTVREFKKILAISLSIFWLSSTLSRVLISFQEQVPGAYGETGNIPRIYMGTDTRISTICAGALLAVLVRSVKIEPSSYDISSKKRIFLLGLICTLFVASLVIRNQHFRDTFRYSIQELAICLLILTGPVFKCWPKSLKTFAESRIIQGIGKSSYSLYLSHSLVLYILSKFVVDNFSPIGSLFWKFTSFMLCLIFGFLSHMAFDYPFEYKRREARRVQSEEQSS